jgi:RIO-like serine/threonine protein kinase
LSAGRRSTATSILDRIGAGAMGVVYTAYDPRLDRRIALKVMHAKPGAQATDVVARVLREAQALARLQHPNVVTVYDANALGEVVYLTMELVEGASLTRWLKSRRGPSPRSSRCSSTPGAGWRGARGGLIHRDFKPDNVLVGDDGRVRVVDFGIARGADGPDLLTVEAALERRRAAQGRRAGADRVADRPRAAGGRVANAAAAGDGRRAVAGGRAAVLPYASTDRGGAGVGAHAGPRRHAAGGQLPTQPVAATVRRARAPERRSSRRRSPGCRRCA